MLGHSWSWGRQRPAPSGRCSGKGTDRSCKIQRSAPTSRLYTRLVSTEAFRPVSRCRHANNSEGSAWGFVYYVLNGSNVGMHRNGRRTAPRASTLHRPQRNYTECG
jgi:hypothetical protein